VKELFYPITGVILAGILIGGAFWGIQPNVTVNGTATDPTQYNSHIIQTETMHKEAVKSISGLCSESSFINAPIKIKSSYLEERNYSQIRSFFTNKYSLSVSLQDTIIFNNDCDIDSNKVKTILEDLQNKYKFKDDYMIETNPSQNNAFIAGSLSEGPVNDKSGSRGISFSGYDIQNGVNKIHIVSDYKNNNVPLNEIPPEGTNK
jgi:hypothetical protein